MKRHVQMTGVRRWAGNDLIELQQQPLQAIDAFFAEYGNCILKGCEVHAASDNTYDITPGFVALAGTDQDNNETFKVVPFAGIEGVTLPVYLTLAHSVIERPYTDGKVKPVAYDFRAAASSILPENVPYLEISVTGGRQFVDAIRLTEKLDQTGNGRDVTVTFAQAAKRENVSSGEKLSVLWGKVCRWFADLKAVAFSGKAADLEEDHAHRFFTDTERDKLSGIAENANRYVHPSSHPASMIDQDTAHRFVSDMEKTAWNSKAAGTHTHKASEVIEETNKRFLTDAERTKINNTYAKTETYARNEIDTKDTAVLDAAKNYVMDRISDVISGSPAALDTLYEIANALNNDPNFATTIMALMNGKADTGHEHTKSQITDFPTSMPASDVYSWAKQSTKPSYTPSEIGAAAANHNHAGTYAPVSHNHTADQVTDTSTRVMMTADERSKLADIEQSIPDVKVKMSEGFIFIYHDELPEKFNDLEPQVVLLRCKKIYKFRKRARGAQKRWCDIKSCTIGLSQEINGNEYFKFQLSPGKWDLLRRLSGQVATVSELTNAFISRRINAEGIQEYVISFCTGKWKYATIGRNFIRKGLFALAIRVNNPDFPVNGFADGIPKYLYGNLTTFNLIFSTDHTGNCCTNLNLRS